MRADKLVFKYLNKTILVRILVCIVLAIGTECLTRTDFSEFSSFFNEQNLFSNTYTLNDINLTNCIDTDAGIVTQSDDPQLEIPAQNTYVSRIALSLKKPVGHMWQIQIFYTDDESADFCEEKSVTQWCSKYDDEILVKLEQNVDRIRIDIGREENVTYTVEQITINPSIIEIMCFYMDENSPLRLIAYALIFWECLDIFCKWLMNRKHTRQYVLLAASVLVIIGIVAVKIRVAYDEKSALSGFRLSSDDQCISVVWDEVSVFSVQSVEISIKSEGGT